MDEARSVLGGGPGVFELARQLRCEFNRQERLFGSQDCVLGVENFQELEDLARDIFIRVRTLKNATKPIHKLPPEVLIRVYSLVPTVRTYSIGHEHSCSFRDVRKLCPLLLVCRHWHRIIMGTSELWATMYDRQDDNYPSSFSAYLRRCPSGPLYVAGEQGASQSLLVLLKANDSRIKELRVTFPESSSAWRHYTPFARLELPALELCAINHQGQCPKMPPLVSLFPASGKLRALELIQAPYVPSSPFPALTTLVLSDLKLNVSMSALLTFLSGSPRLEHIHLEYICPWALEETDPGNWRQRRIPLDYLRELAVHDQFRRQDSQQPGILAAYRKTLLSMICFPASCALSFSHLITLSDIQHFLNLAWGPGRTAPVARFSTYVDRCSAWPPIRRGEHEWCVMNLLDPVEHLEATFSVYSPGLFRSEHRREGATLVPRMLRVLERYPAFSSIRMLWVEDLTAWPFGGEYVVLSFPPRLEFLVVERSSLGDPLSAAVDILQPMAPDGRIMCPALSTLMLDCRCEQDDPPQRARIHAVAAARAAAGHPIRRLMLAYYENREDFSGMCHVYDSEGAVVRRVNVSVAYKELADEWAERMNWKYPRFDSDDGLDSNLASDTAQEDAPEDADETDGLDPTPLI